MRTRLEHYELWPEKLPDSFILRAEQTMRFIKLRGRVADCGEYNPLALMIEQRHEVIIHSLEWDFNYPYPTREKYDTILCFEVLEHLFNPLLFLETLREMLADEGSIYLSTPRQWPGFLRAVHHYHEIPTDRLMWLFEAAELKVVRRGRVTIAGHWWQHLYGIRPILRYFQTSRIYELKLK